MGNNWLIHPAGSIGGNLFARVWGKNMLHSVRQETANGSDHLKSNSSYLYKGIRLKKNEGAITAQCRGRKHQVNKESKISPGYWKWG